MLEDMSTLWAVVGKCEDFWSVLGHENGVFELRGQFSVLRADCPAVLFVENGFPVSFIDHGFDGKTDAWFDSLESGLLIRKMRYGWFLMEPASHSVSYIFPHHAIAHRVRFSLNGPADFYNRIAGPD